MNDSFSKRYISLLGHDVSVADADDFELKLLNAEEGSQSIKLLYSFFSKAILTVMKEGTKNSCIHC